MANTIFEQTGGTYTNRRLYVARFITGGRTQGKRYDVMSAEDE